VRLVLFPETRRKTMRKLALVCISLCIVAMLALLPAHQPARADEVTYDFEVVDSYGYGYEGSSNNYYIVRGIVKNTGTTNTKNIFVRAQIFWTGGTKRGEASYQTDIEILRPGETSPFDVWVSYCCPELIDYYTLDVVGLETTEEPYESLRFIPETANVFVKESNRWLYGEMQNVSSDYLDRLLVYVAWFDPTGRLTQVSAAFDPFSAYLGPGVKCPFADTVSIFELYGSYQVWYTSAAMEPGLYPVPLSIAVTNSYFGGYGGDDFIVEGTITNNGDVSAESYDTTTVITYRDSLGRVVDYSVDTYPEEVGPGQTKSFRHEDISPPDEFTTFDIVVWTESTTTTQPPTPTPTITPTPTNTPANTPTATPTTTPTITPTPTNTLTPSAWIYLPIVLKNHGIVTNP
jgi:hypothetical protein